MAARGDAGDPDRGGAQIPASPAPRPRLTLRTVATAPPAGAVVLDRTGRLPGRVGPRGIAISARGSPTGSGRAPGWCVGGPYGSRPAVVDRHSKIWAAA